MSDFVALATGLLAVIAAASLVAVVVSLWLWAIGDVFWMLALKPLLIGPALIVIGFFVALATFAAMPAVQRTDGDLPIFTASLVAPVIVRWISDQLARLEFRFRAKSYGFSLEDGEIEKSGLFLLVEARQVALYVPPVSEDNGVSVPIEKA